MFTWNRKSWAEALTLSQDRQEGMCMLQPASLSGRISIWQLDVQGEPFCCGEEMDICCRSRSWHMSCACSLRRNDGLLRPNCEISPEPHGMSYCVIASGRIVISRVGWLSPGCLTESDV